MLGLIRVFRALYLAGFLMQMGSASLMTYLALRLKADGSADFWGVALMAANALGMIIGGKVGYFFKHVGHIRTYVACAEVGSAAVLAHTFNEYLFFWLGLRVLVGLAVMCQMLVLESWFNECVQNHQRGGVLALYMTATYVGSVLGQLMLSINKDLSTQFLIFVSIAFSLCLVPIALTKSVHPDALNPGKLKVKLLVKRLPQSLLTVLTSGMINGSFYGLAGIFANHKGLSTQEVGFFMALVISAGLIAQWPLGLLSDRFSRTNLVRTVAILLAIFSLLVSFVSHISTTALFLLAAAAGSMHFCLYPLGVALANDNIESDLRVSLAGVLLITYGMGTAIGPLITGFAMDLFGPYSLYYAFVICALVLAFFVSEKNIKGDYLVGDAPLEHQATPNGLVGSTLAVVMEPENSDDELDTLEQTNKHSNIK